MSLNNPINPGLRWIPSPLIRNRSPRWYGHIRVSPYVAGLGPIVVGPILSPVHGPGPIFRPAHRRSITSMWCGVPEQPFSAFLNTSALSPFEYFGRYMQSVWREMQGGRVRMWLTTAPATKRDKTSTSSGVSLIKPSADTTYFWDPLRPIRWHCICKSLIPLWIHFFDHQSPQPQLQSKIRNWQSCKDSYHSVRIYHHRS